MKEGKKEFLRHNYGLRVRPHINTLQEILVKDKIILKSPLGC